MQSLSVFPVAEPCVHIGVVFRIECCIAFDIRLSCAFLPIVVMLAHFTAVREFMKAVRRSVTFDATFAGVRLACVAFFPKVFFLYPWGDLLGSFGFLIFPVKRSARDPIFFVRVFFGGVLGPHSAC